MALVKPRLVLQLNRLLSTSIAEGTLPNYERRDKQRHVKLPTVALPAPLQVAVDKIFSEYPNKTLSIGGQALLKYLDGRQPLAAFETRRKLPGKWDDPSTLKHAQIRYGKKESVLYAASRIQACYGTALRVFKELANVDPAFKPATLLDFGSGLGTVSWAADQVWNGSLYEHQTVDVSNEMGELAHLLRREGKDLSMSSFPDPQEHIPGVYFKRFLPMSNKISYDIVVAAYSLSELSSIHKLKEVVSALWLKTNDYIVLVEQANERGFDAILQARDYILKANEWKHASSSHTDQLTGHVIAPCPHDLKCPVASKQICFFGQNVALSLAQKNTPLIQRGIFVENFSYVVIKKGSPRPLTNGDTGDGHYLSRLLLPVKSRTKHMICSVCTHNGKACHVILSKGKDREIYKYAKNMKWGDCISLTDDQLQRNSTRNIVSE